MLNRDMVAERQLIEDHAALCTNDRLWRCILVQQRGHADGVLVMPEDGCYVGWAAYYSELICPCLAKRGRGSDHSLSF